MDITPLIPKDKNVIHSYGPEGFKVNQEIYKNPLLITADQLIELKLNSLEEIDWQVLKENIVVDLEILLIGTGNNHLSLSNKMKNQIKNHYPLAAINEMTSAAACRTYNILISEERKVGAILIPIKND